MSRAGRALYPWVLGCVFVIAGCSGFSDRVSGAFSRSDRPQPAPRYLDFKGVLIPGEMQRVQAETYIINQSGRLVLSGKVRGESLADYFAASMKADGWAFLTRYSYQGSLKLFFRRPEAFASILITENPLETKVEIWLVPLTR